MAEIIPGLLSWIDRQKQAAKANFSLLVDDPKEFVVRPDYEAQMFNNALGLSSQKRRNEIAGKSVTPEQQAGYDYAMRVMSDSVLPDSMKSVGGLPLWNVGQRAVSENVRKMATNPQEFADFTFLIAPRQQEMLIKRQTARGGKLPGRYSILASKENDAIHPTVSRAKGDAMTPPEIANLFDAVYDGANQIGIDPGNVNKFFLVNTRKDFGKDRRGVGLFGIRDGEINPLTAYPASKEKVEGILAAPKKEK